MEDAFFVICDDRVNSAQEAAAGVFQMVIGFAAVRRGEFHSFRIRHTACGSNITPVSLNRINSQHYSPDELGWLDDLSSQLHP